MAEQNYHGTLPYAQHRLMVRKRCRHGSSQFGSVHRRPVSDNAHLFHTVHHTTSLLKPLELSSTILLLYLHNANNTHPHSLRAPQQPVRLPPYLNLHRHPKTARVLDPISQLRLQRRAKPPESYFVTLALCNAILFFSSTGPVLDDDETEVLRAYTQEPGR